MAGPAAARAPAMARASGSSAHSPMSRDTAAGSAATLAGPSLAASNCLASVRLTSPSGSGIAPSAVVSPASADLLVTTTRQPGAAGSSGRTCAGSLALSSRISIRRPARTDR